MSHNFFLKKSCNEPLKGKRREKEPGLLEFYYLLVQSSLGAENMFLS